MDLVEFMKSDLENGYCLTIQNDEQYIFTKEFTDRSKTKKFFSFKFDLEKNLSEETLIDVLTLINSEELKFSLFVEVEYNDKSQNEVLEDLYNTLSIFGVCLTVLPSKSVVEEDYLQVLDFYRKKILNEENNKILVYPVNVFIEYYQLKLIIDNFVDEKENEKLSKLLNPEPSEYLTNVFFQNHSKEWFNDLKFKFYEEISEEDKKEYKETTEKVIATLITKL